MLYLLLNLLLNIAEIDPGDMNNENQGGSEDDDSDDDDIKITIDHNKIDEAKTSYQVKLIIRSNYLTLIEGISLMGEPI